MDALWDLRCHIPKNGQKKQEYEIQGLENLSQIREFSTIYKHLKEYFFGLKNTS